MAEFSNKKAKHCPADLSALSLADPRVKQCRDNRPINPETAGVLREKELEGQTLYNIASRLQKGFELRGQSIPISKIGKDLIFINGGKEELGAALDLRRLSYVHDAQIKPSQKQATTKAAGPMSKPDLSSLSFDDPELVRKHRDNAPIDPKKLSVLEGKALLGQTTWSIANRVSEGLEAKGISISTYQLVNDIQKYCYGAERELRKDDRVDLSKIPYLRKFARSIDTPHVKAEEPKRNASAPRAKDADTVHEKKGGQHAPPLQGASRSHSRDIDHSKTEKRASSLIPSYPKTKDGLLHPTELKPDKKVQMSLVEVAKLANKSVEELFGTMAKHDRDTLKGILVALSEKESSRIPGAQNKNGLDAGLCQVNRNTAKGLLLMFGDKLEPTLEKPSPFRKAAFFGDDHLRHDPGLKIRFDPEVSMKLAALYLKSLHDTVPGKTWEHALLAYRHGPKTLATHLAQHSHQSNHAHHDAGKKLTYGNITWEADYAVKILNNPEVAKVRHLFNESPHMDKTVYARR